MAFRELRGMNCRDSPISKTQSKDRGKTESQENLQMTLHVKLHRINSLYFQAIIIKGRNERRKVHLNIPQDGQTKQNKCQGQI